MARIPGVTFGRAAMAPVALSVMLPGGCTDRPQDAYQTVTVERRSIRDIVPATGELRDSGDVAVPAAVDGWVTSVAVRLGQQVRKGDVLATFRLRAPGAERADAGSDLEQAGYAREMARNALAKAAGEFTSLRPLEERGFVSRARLATLQADVKARRLEVRAADARIAALQRRIRQLDATTSDRTRLRSPCDCRVEDINLVDGQAVSGTLPDAFFLSSGGEAMTIRAKVPEDDLGRIGPNTGIRFGVEAIPDRTFPASLRYISSRAVKDGRFTYYVATMDVTRTNDTIRSGMTANVEFVNVDAANVVAFPVAALYFQPDDYVPLMSPAIEKTYRRARTDDERRVAQAIAVGFEFGFLLREGKRRIFVLKGDTVERRLVRVGAETDDLVEAASGLAPGERVVVKARAPS